MKNKKDFEKTIKGEDVKEQFAKVEFFDTGEDKNQMPKHHSVEVRGMTQAQIFLASIAMLETAIEGFTKNGGSATTFLANVIRGSMEGKVFSLNLDCKKKENALEEMLKLLKAAAEKKAKDE